MGQMHGKMSEYKQKVQLFLYIEDYRNVKLISSKRKGIYDMKRKLLVLLGISVISVSAFGVTSYAEAEDATEAAENVGEAEEETATQEELPQVTGDEKISELIDLSTLSEEEGMPDIASMTLAQWNAYEFHKDYATVISDVTSYDHDWERQLLDTHWNTYIMCTTPNELCVQHLMTK